MVSNLKLNSTLKKQTAHSHCCMVSRSHPIKSILGQKCICLSLNIPTLLREYMSMQNISAKTSGNTSGFCQDIKGVPKCIEQIVLIIVCTKSLYTMVKRKKVIMYLHYFDRCYRMIYFFGVV